MPAFILKMRDSINVMEAKMTANGGLDFEPNFEMIFGGLLQEVLEQRLQAFRDLVAYHKVSQKALSAGKSGKPIRDQRKLVAFDRKWTDIQSAIFASMAGLGSFSTRISAVQ